MTEEPTKAEILGRSFADTIILSAHMAYNAPRGVAIVKACIARLQERIGEIQPKKADPAYKKARYDKKDK